MLACAIDNAAPAYSFKTYKARKEKKTKRRKMLDVFSRICRHFSTLNSTPLAHSSAALACLFKFFSSIPRPTCSLRKEKEKKKATLSVTMFAARCSVVQTRDGFCTATFELHSMLCLGDALYNTAASVQEPPKETEGTCAAVTFSHIVFIS